MSTLSQADIALKAKNVIDKINEIVRNYQMEYGLPYTGQVRQTIEDIVGIALTVEITKERERIKLLLAQMPSGYEIDNDTWTKINRPQEEI